MYLYSIRYRLLFVHLLARITCFMFCFFWSVSLLFHCVSLNECKTLISVEIGGTEECLEKRKNEKHIFVIALFFLLFYIRILLVFGEASKAITCI